MTRIQRRILLGALVVWAVVAIPVITHSVTYNTNTPSLIRMHVRADSDQPRAQYLKELVSRELVTYLSHAYRADDAGSFDAAVGLLERQLPQIAEVARNVLAREGEVMEVRVQLGVFSYGPREYFGHVVPPGDYVALEVTLGSGEGRNFWCILFPGMCFVPQEVEELAAERARGAIAEAAAPPPETSASTGDTERSLRFGWLWLDKLFSRPRRDVPEAVHVAMD